ncbi:MAG: hypothetical protein OEM24_07920, partial [Paracoccaceae bacterium]|nr:hypothetical protein [Paracoccaceae bacterium]
MRELCLGFGLLLRLIGAVLVLAFAGPALAADEQYEIFRPLAPAAEPPDFAAALRAAGVLAEGQGVDALSPAQRAAVAALEAAAVGPSMATSVGLLAHFETFAADGNAAMRLALIEAARPVFLMAEAAKFELVLQTNKRIQAAERGRGAGRGIAVSLRVGSTGLRFAQWQQWVAAGRPTEAPWTFTDPNSGQTATFDGMPIDQTYQDAKLFRSDDDVTNWASAQMRASDPSANESINGARAAQDFAAVTADILRDYPEEFREAALGGRASVAPGEMKVEFLSPTEAVKIMGTRLLREGRGWSAPIQLEEKVHFLGEWILSDPEKYNGLYAEEQLHAWGMANGYVT